MTERIIIGDSHKGPEAYCPTCKSLLDGFTGIGNQATEMKLGDVTICAYCGVVLEVIAYGIFKTLSAENLRERLAVDINLRIAYFIIQKVLSKRPI